MANRIYTQRDQLLEHALDTAARVGLVADKSSYSERLRALALYADARLTEEAELTERVAAYEQLAQDEARSLAIRASVDAAVADGIL